MQHYMNQANNAGFDELAGYKKNYRNNTRVTAFSQELAADIFSRIKEFLPREVVVDKVRRGGMRGGRSVGEEGGRGGRSVEGGGWWEGREGDGS